MSNNAEKPIGIFYEHPAWFKPLFEELEARRIPFVRIQAAQHSYNPAEVESPFSLVVNRMSSSAYLRGNTQGIFHAANYLAHLERLGVPTINGVAAQNIESSKAKQLSLLTSLGILYPKTKVVNHISQLVPSAKTLQLPIVVKVNIGGSGAGIVRFDTMEGLQKAIDLGQINLGIDHTALVQEYIVPAGNHIVRIETLSGKFLYAIKVHTTGESFNLCPAELCQVPDPNDVQACLTEAPKKGIQVESYTPPAELIQKAEKIFQTAGIDVGGIEYLTDGRTGQAYFYDINALSNFVADAENVIGFNPYKNFVDYIEQRLQNHYQTQPAYTL
jgi:glutathione synthase/RimK-type ligase-like ATP-grasp enzyme